MRATKDTIAHMSLCRDELENTHTKEAIHNHRKSVKYAKVQFHSLIWSMFWKHPKADQEAIIANQGDRLDNTHLETALKLVWKEYK